MFSDQEKQRTKHMENRSINAEGGGEQSASNHEQLLEHQKQKIRKLTEQRNDEIEKYNIAQREYYELIQQFDRVSFFFKFFSQNRIYEKRFRKSFFFSNF